MGGCLNPSGQIPFVPPKPNWVSGTYVAPSYCDILFDVPMDETVTPSFDSLFIYVDSVWRAIIGFSWQSSTVLRVDFGVIPTTSGTVGLVKQDVNLRSLPGTMSKPPEHETFYP